VLQRLQLNLPSFDLVYQISASKSYIEQMLERFEEYGLTGSIESVLDVFWKISYPILPLVDPSSYNEHLKNGTLKDRRAVLKNDPESKYKPKNQKASICFDYEAGKNFLMVALDQRSRRSCSIFAGKSSVGSFSSSLRIV
jgi:hypothetical protein